MTPDPLNNTRVIQDADLGTVTLTLEVDPPAICYTSATVGFSRPYRDVGALAAAWVELTDDQALANLQYVIERFARHTRDAALIELGVIYEI